MSYRLLSIDAVVDDSPETHIVAVSDSAKPIVGFVSLKHKGLRSAQFAKLFVDEAWRRHGVGSALVNFCCARADQSECESINAVVHHDNLEVMPFYRKLGFRVAFEWAEDRDLLIFRALNEVE